MLVFPSICPAIPNPNTLTSYPLSSPWTTFPSGDQPIPFDRLHSIPLLSDFIRSYFRPNHSFSRIFDDAHLRLERRDGFLHREEQRFERVKL